MTVTLRRLAGNALVVPAILALSMGSFSPAAAIPAAGGHGATAPWKDPSPHHIRFVTVAPDVRLEVLDWGGSGPPLVFLAGFGNSAHVFDGFAPRLTDAFHVYGITRRGFGASSLPPDGYDNATLAQDILTTLDRLRLRRSVLVGHSFAGAELNEIGSHHPEHARKLIYLEGGFDFAELYASPRWLNTPFPRPPLLPGDQDSPGSRARYSSRATGPGYPESEVRSNDARSLRIEKSPGFHPDSLPAWLERGTPSAELSSIRLPALAIYGVAGSVKEKYPYYDSLDTTSQAKARERFEVERPLLERQRSRFRAEVKGARVVEVPGGRHFIFLTHPDLVEREIRNFARWP